MIRILGGAARGRAIATPAGSATRPTAAVVREAVFGMLQGALEGARVLDLFCGSGAYAFEALSRGAACAVLVDSDDLAVAVARQNAATLGFTHAAKVYKNDYLRAAQALVRRKTTFDILFLDPPYGGDYYQKALAACRELLHGGGFAVCEHAAQHRIDGEAGYEMFRHRRYGNRAITILTRGNGI
jgi:16S rRNA (guanine966-N2)-methyltransferase